MAELAPWLQPEPTSGNLAPWLVNQPGYGEDMAKAAISGTAQGVIGLPGIGGDLQQLAKGASDKATEKGVNPFGWLTGKFDETGLGKFLKEESAKTLKKSPSLANSGDMMMSGIPLPTSHDIQSKVEEKTGPFYEAKTAPGKAVQTAAQVAPSLLLGGEGLLPAITKATGAGIVSEGAGETADKLKGYLPDSAQPWAEPVMRAVGAGAGLFAPAMVRRTVTPLPMTNERLATVSALRNTNPELVNASSAGQLTESPRIMAAEGRSPRMAGLPERQNEAYTRGVMRQAGSDGMFDAAGLNQAQGTGAQLEALRNAHRMSPAEFANLNQGVEQERKQLYRAVGDSEPFDRIRDEIKLGPTGGNPVPLDMTGQRYGALKQILQSASEGAPTSHEQMAIANSRRRLNEAFHNSMPADEAARLQRLDQQYSNYKTLESIPTKAGENTVTPQQVFSKAGRNSDLETHADQATRVMTPLPPRNTEVSDIVHLLGSLSGAATHGAAGYGMGGAALALPAAGEGALTGLFTAPHYVNAAKDLVGRVVANPVTQEYLKNQRWRPGPATSSDPATILRLLMSPPEAGLLNGPRQ